MGYGIGYQAQKRDPAALTDEQQRAQTQAGTAQGNLSSFLNDPRNANPGVDESRYQPYLNQAPMKQITATYGGASVGPAAQYAGAQVASPYQQSLGQVQSLASQGAPDLSAQNTIAQLYAAFAPQRQQANSALNDQLAQAGLVGGPAVMAHQNLEARLTAALAPQLAAAIQQSQSNQLQQSQFGANALLNAYGANVNAINQRGLAQAGYDQQAGLANASARNANALSNAQFQQQAGLAGVDAINAGNSAYVGATNATNASNTAARNNAQQNLLNALQQQYAQQLASFNDINTAALGARNSVAVNSAQNFGVPTAGDSGLGAQLAALYAPRSASIAATAAPK